MRFYTSILFLVLGLNAFAQKEVIDFNAVDSLYREDQFYLSFTYSNLQKKPANLNQNKFSPGLSFGFLRDMPINKKRTVAIAAGLGYSFNIYNSNMLIDKDNILSLNDYQIITAADFSKSKLSMHFVEFPIEFRWRTSTPESHKFWRIYTGFKVKYLFYDQYKYKEATTTIKASSNSDLNKLQYGAYIASGWNGFTFYGYYGLNPIFKSSAKIDDKSIEMQTINIGLIFYIL